MPTTSDIKAYMRHSVGEWVGDWGVVEEEEDGGGGGPGHSLWGSSLVRSSPGHRRVERPTRERERLEVQWGECPKGLEVLRQRWMAAVIRAVKRGETTHPQHIYAIHSVHQLTWTHTFSYLQWYVAMQIVLVIPVHILRYLYLSIYLSISTQEQCVWFSQHIWHHLFPETIPPILWLIHRTHRQKVFYSNYVFGRQ